MAPSLQIKNVPDALHGELRARASTLGMSLSDYVLGLLEDAAARPSVAEVQRRARGRSGGASTDDIVAVIRQARDAR